ncbi:hypothetical protein C8F01DRAFT_1127746 [Mycena amicta]|nr:hypothetical protein C8F01DRAFT_1127746 [Mycena amicta]
MSDSRYGSDAQRMAGDFAAHLHDYRAATKEHHTGFYVAVMEHVDKLVDPEEQLHRQTLIQLLNHFRTSGIVHGDLRPQNIIFLADGKVKVIDWDWAGLKDENPRYPWIINMQNDWADGVAAGELMEHEHDRYQIQLLFKDLGWALLPTEQGGKRKAEGPKDPQVEKKHKSH